MNLLATQRCVEIRQEIGWTEKRIVETSFDLKLFEDQITTKDDTFPITSIFDISYRKKAEQGAMGFLYLHTSQGVKTYYIKEEPTSLVKAYQKLKLERPELR